jgi:hypothetical protein
VAAADTVCADGRMFDTYEIVEGDTIEAAAERLGLTPSDTPFDLETVNRFGVNGVPEFTAGDVWVPCVRNWPQRVAFSNLADPVLCTDSSIQGYYTVAPGEESPTIAATFGVTEAELQAENPGFDIWWSDPGSFVINVCVSWFEG